MLPSSRPPRQRLSQSCLPGQSRVVEAEAAGPLVEAVAAAEQPHPKAAAASRHNISLIHAVQNNTARTFLEYHQMKVYAGIEKMREWHKLGCVP